MARICTQEAYHRVTVAKRNKRMRSLRGSWCRTGPEGQAWEVLFEAPRLDKHFHSTEDDRWKIKLLTPKLPLTLQKIIIMHSSTESLTCKLYVIIWAFGICLRELFGRLLLQREVNLLQKPGFKNDRVAFFIFFEWKRVAWHGRSFYVRIGGLPSVNSPRQLQGGFNLLPLKNVKSGVKYEAT